jgi:phosphate/sulfate permease
MSDQNNLQTEQPVSDSNLTLRDFFVRMARDLLRDLFVIVFVFLLSTGIYALFLIYYGLPLVLSLIGGLFVLGIALAFKSNSIFE